MISMLIYIRAPWVRVWFPLIIVWLLLLPLIILLLPITLLACAIIGNKALRALRAFWELISALRGTRIEMNDGKHVVAVRIV